MLFPGQQARLTVISRVVDMLNQGYKTHLDAEMQALVSDFVKLLDKLLCHGSYIVLPSG